MFAEVCGKSDDMSVSFHLAFEQRYKKNLVRKLGYGKDGEVYLTHRNTAVKFFEIKELFDRERQVYEVLTRRNIEEIAGHTVPTLIIADAELLVIEMSIVEPPFLLDFVSACPQDEVPQFAEEDWETWYEDKQDQFGKHWPHVELILAEFRRRTGYVLMDVNPGNIKFAD